MNRDKSRNAGSTSGTAPSGQRSIEAHALRVRRVAFAKFAAAAVAGLIGGDAVARDANAAESEGVQISDARVPPTEKVGSNIPLSMVVKNSADIADALMRVRCPIANFQERHTVDRGEGAPSMRSIPSIPIAAGKTTTLKPDAFHVMLLQTRQPLVAGEKFKCAIVFQRAGTIETEVTVANAP